MSGKREQAAGVGDSPATELVIEGKRNAESKKNTTTEENVGKR